MNEAKLVEDKTMLVPRRLKRRINVFSDGEKIIVIRTPITIIYDSSPRNKYVYLELKTEST